MRVGYAARLEAAWNIGSNANGGYAVLPALRAMLDLAAHPDPLSLTVHYLRPAEGDGDADVTAGIVRAGRSTTNATATLAQDGTVRLVAHAVLGNLAEAAHGAAPDPGLTPAPPDLPPPDRCVDRRQLGQGVDLPILTRLDVRIRPEQVTPDPSNPAVVEGWIRFADGAPPETRWLPLLADAFPPALRTRMGRGGMGADDRADRARPSSPGHRLGARPVRVRRRRRRADDRDRNALGQHRCRRRQVAPTRAGAGQVSGRP